MILIFEKEKRSNKSNKKETPANNCQNTLSGSFKRFKKQINPKLANIRPFALIEESIS